MQVQSVALQSEATIDGIFESFVGVFFGDLFQVSSGHICYQAHWNTSCKGCRPSQLHGTKASSDTKPRRMKSCIGRHMPSALSFPACDCSPVLQVWRQTCPGPAGSKISTIDVRAPALKALPGDVCEPEHAPQRPHCVFYSGSLAPLPRLV